MPIRPSMNASDLRVAIFSGNYNYVRDGANQALNRLADSLLRGGAAVRVYWPTAKEPAFEPRRSRPHSRSGDPGRSEYKLGWACRRGSGTTSHSGPTSSMSPAPTSRSPAVPRRANGISRYRLGPYPLRNLSALLRHGLSRTGPAGGAAPFLPRLRPFSRRPIRWRSCSRQRMNYDVGIWTRGIDREIFNPGPRRTGGARSAYR